MLKDIWNYLHLDVHHYMDLLDIKGQLVRGVAVNDNAANDNVVQINPLDGLPGGDSKAVA